MKLYNTMTKQYEELVPLDGETVKMYACGPTVYDFFHVGNARCFVVFDFLRRYLEYRGYKVNFTQNFTDIDDKMIKRANEEGTTVKEVAEKYIAEYFTDAKGLGVKPATNHPRATENIDEIIDIVKTLVDNGYAYAVKPDESKEDYDVYFRTRKFKGYGKLSHKDIDDLISGARIDVADIKEDPLDFAVWKATKPGEPYWASPWGNGRPGWHIECSAMSKKYLGNNIDIHAGGEDLAFPHHENEIAQSESYNECKCCSDTTFTKMWLHNAYILTDGQKMSKSGISFKVRDVAKTYGYEAIRFFIISAHYRSPVNYCVEAMNQAKTSVERFHTCEDNLTFRIKVAKENGTREINDEEKALLESFAGRRTQMIEALDYDFNTADGIAAIFELTRDINKALASDDLSVEFLEKAKEIFMELVTLFGFEKKESENSDEDAEIDALVAQRAEAKKAKDWATADKIRDDLKARGIVIEDTPQGAKWKRV